MAAEVAVAVANTAVAAEMAAEVGTPEAQAAAGRHRRRWW
jgi:hypothetical protein